MINNKKTNCKPFLRWAGGKNWLVKHLDYLVPRNGFRNYHEPFLGGGSIFLSLNPANTSFLSDLNKDLIDTFISVKNNPNKIIKVLETYKNKADFYYYLRNKQFEDPIEKAAQFIFLNQTSFNGIYRVNLKGEYNVPYAYRTKDFVQPNIIKLVSNSLKKAILFSGDFSISQQNIKKNDFVFLDPPYTVSHNDNGFIKYNQKLFSLDDQLRLSELIDFIKRKEAYYLLTNATHKTIAEIFDKGDVFISLNRANVVGGIKAHRGYTTEYIFTNIKN